MNRLQLIVLFLSLSIFTLAQNNEKNDGRDALIEGYILDCDSIPIESAYLISYKTLRAYATDENGYFSIKVFPDDSLKVHHLAFKPIILKPDESQKSQDYILEFSENEIEAVNVKYRDLELEYFEKNMKIIHKQLAKLGNYNYANARPSNPYNPHDQFTNTSGINISELIRLFKKR